MRDVVHIGMHKTGTTWLQADVFPTSERTYYDPWKPTQRRSFERLVDDDVWSPNELQSMVEPHDRVLLSWEVFSGRVWDGAPERERTAGRLAGVLRDPGVVIVTRDPGQWVVAMYRQYVNEGGVCDFETFVAGDAPGCGFHLDLLDHERLISLYRDRFEHVLVMQHEDLRADPVGQIARLSEWSGDSLEPVKGARNVSLNARRVRVLRAANRLRRSRFHEPMVAVRGIPRLRRLLQG